MSGVHPYRARRRTISLTPLIDVVFILLMFFMLTSTFMHWKAIDLWVPVASPGGDAQKLQPVILHADGALSLHGRPLAWSDADAADTDAVDGPAVLDPARTVVVFPEADARVQTIVTAFERLAAHGIVGATLGDVLDRRTEP